jgi:predicted metal-dependent HD superfamily phosphohydrolase
MLPEVRWHALSESLGCQADAELEFQRLALAYNQTGRDYHNWQHIIDCLARFDEVVHLIANPLMVETAIWYHDAVYDPKASDNEERSAELCLKFLSKCNRCHDAMTVCNMIMATRHDRPSADSDTRYLLDIDLSILGRNADEFERYNDAIRKEYAWVPTSDYREGRKRVLTGFLERARIYATDYFLLRFENQARINLKSAIAALEKGIR